MDQKQTKKLLVEAKNAIKNKDYKLVVQNCQAILLQDDSDYNALVFMAVAQQELQNVDKALHLFKKATEISPNQILAWQGLQKFYERRNFPEHSSNLQQVYLKLLELTSDGDKSAEILYKLGSVYMEDKILNKAEECFMKALDIEKSTSVISSLSDKLCISLVSCFISQTNLSQDQLITLQVNIDNVYAQKLSKNQEYENWSYDSLDQYFNFYIRELLPANALLETAEKFKVIFTQNIVGILKWKLRGFIFGFIIGDTLLNESDVEEISSVLSDSDKDGIALILFAKGILFYLKENWVSSKDALKKGLSISPVCCWESWLLMCWVLDKFRDGTGIEHYAKEGLKLVSKRVTEHKQPQIKNIFNFALGKGYFYQSNNLSLEKSIVEFLKITDSSLMSQALYFQGYAYIKLGEFEKVDDVIAQLKKFDSALYSGLCGIYCTNKKRLKEARECFNEALSSPHKSFHGDWLLELGDLCALENDMESACQYFRKAADASPYNFKPHLLLGNYFRLSLKDLKQAEKCFKQAYSLKKYDEEIGIYLSDIYYANNNEEENLSLLQEVTTHNAVGRCKWAWLRMGLLYLRQGNNLNAIRALQSALTADPQDKECWECLAEAYLKHGSYVSALKAFNRVLEIDSEALYSAYQMANIKLNLGLHKEAAELFLKLLVRVPTYVPALKGLGEVYLFRARFYIKLCEPFRVLSFCQSALEPTFRALTESPNLICLWKLLGDICTAVGPLNKDMVSMTIPTTLLKGIPKYNSEMIELKKNEILILGARCYSLACEKSSKCSLIWHDLAVNYYYQASEVKEDKVSILKKATAFAKQSISLDPTNSSHWNILGTIAVSPAIRNYQLAQHCFIKAVTVAPKDPISWANLGSFYLLNDNITLSHKALSIAQSLEPSYPNSWIGLAVCAENVGHDDTMDLLRHCTTLSNHTESCIGYGSWVCDALTDVKHSDREYDYHIKEMNAIPTAVDCITRYTNVVTDVSCAYNILGLLLERQGLLRSAATFFEKALLLIQMNNDSNVTKLDLVHCNVARVYRALRKFENSTKCALAVKDMDFFNLCGLAFTYYLQDYLQDSSSTYELAYNMAESDVEKAHLLVALASVAYSVQGSNEAKTLLFQSCEVKPDCTQALFALSALSILENDLDTLTAVLDELSAIQQDETTMIHTTFLQSCQAILQGEVRAGRNILCKAVHRWPANFEIWKVLSNYLLKNDASCLNLAVNCALASVKLNSKPNSKSLRLLCITYFYAGLKTKALSTAKHLIHYYPGEDLNWEILNKMM